MKEPTYGDLYAFASKVRTCASVDTVSSIRAEAAYLFGEPTGPCPHCGHPLLPDDICPCERFLNEPSNPASEQFKKVAR